MPFAPLPEPVPPLPLAPSGPTAELAGLPVALLIVPFAVLLPSPVPFLLPVLVFPVPAAEATFEGSFPFASVPVLFALASFAEPFAAVAGSTKRYVPALTPLPAGDGFGLEFAEGLLGRGFPDEAIWLRTAAAWLPVMDCPCHGLSPALGVPEFADVPESFCFPSAPFSLIALFFDESGRGLAAIAVVGFLPCPWLLGEGIDAGLNPPALGDAFGVGDDNTLACERIALRVGDGVVASFGVPDFAVGFCVVSGREEGKGDGIIRSTPIAIVDGAGDGIAFFLSMFALATVIR